MVWALEKDKMLALPTLCRDLKVVISSHSHYHFSHYFEVKKMNAKSTFTYGCALSNINFVVSLCTLKQLLFLMAEGSELH